jgi:hypothetical protein
MFTFNISERNSLSKPGLKRRKSPKFTIYYGTASVTFSRNPFNLRAIKINNIVHKY